MSPLARGEHERRDAAPHLRRAIPGLRRLIDVVGAADGGGPRRCLELLERALALCREPLGLARIVRRNVSERRAAREAPSGLADLADE